MKSNPSLSKLLYFFIVIGIFSFFTSNQIKADVKDDLKKITSKLRCMTCQNQSIYDSESDFSIDIKKIVEQKLKKNESEKEIIDFLVKRYGEYIVFKPQMSKQNIFLWLFPFIIMALCLAFLIFRIKKNQ